MQYHSKETLHLTKKLGELMHKLRIEKYKSIQRFAFEYDLERSNYSRIERAKVDCKFTSFFKIAQALGIKPSEFLKLLEKELGDDFSLIED